MKTWKSWPALVALAVLASCGPSHMASGAPAGGTAPPPRPATTTTATPAPGDHHLPTTTATPAPVAHNLPLTPDIRTELLAAGAKSHGLTAADFAGLRAGETYYAVDTAKVYWAAAALDPDPSSIQAQVSSQDNGAYLLFERPAGGAWRVFDVGLAGVGGTPCPIAVPPAVLAVWGWPAHSCRPAVIS